MRFRHWGVNERGDVVFEGERRVLLKRRAFRPARERAGEAGTLARNRRGTAAAARQKPPARRAVRARAAAAKKSGARPRRRR